MSRCVGTSAGSLTCSEGCGRAGKRIAAHPAFGTDGRHGGGEVVLKAS